MITEKEYLKCLKVVRDYRCQIENQIKDVETYSLGDKKDFILKLFKKNKSFNRTKVANELNISRGYICKVLREKKN